MHDIQLNNFGQNTAVASWAAVLAFGTPFGFFVLLLGSASAGRESPAEPKIPDRAAKLIGWVLHAQQKQTNQKLMFLETIEYINIINNIFTNMYQNNPDYRQHVCIIYIGYKDNLGYLDKCW